jgi:hypothetical protein
MSDGERLRRLARLLYGIAAVMFVGTFVELLAAKHFQEPIQLLPIVLCVVGLVLVLLAWKRPNREIIQAMRGAMVLIAAASVLGVWKHIEGNLGFVREMHPDTSGLPLVLGAITGRAPLLASGALAATGVVAIVATFAAGWNPRGETLTERRRAPKGAMGSPAPSS